MKMSEKKLFTVSETLNVIPMSRSGLWQAIKRGDVPVLKIGKRVFIQGWWISKVTAPPNSVA
jgi:hypothetical protein